MPRRLQDLSLEIGRANTVLTNRLARTPSTAEIACYLQVAESDVIDAQTSAAAETIPPLSCRP